MAKHALFKDGEQVSKAHDWRLPVVIEALEAGAVRESPHPDFPGDPIGKWLADGYEIREVEE